MIGQEIEQAGLGSAGNAGEPRVPFTKDDAQLIAQLGQVLEMSFEIGQALRNQRSDAPTRRTATIALRQGARQIVEREADGEGAPDEPDPGDGIGRIPAVPTLAARRKRKDPLALVVAQRIGADAGQPCELRRAE